MVGRLRLERFGREDREPDVVAFAARLRDRGKVGVRSPGSVFSDLSPKVSGGSPVDTTATGRGSSSSSASMRSAPRRRARGRLPEGRKRLIHHEEGVSGPPVGSRPEGRPRRFPG